MRLILFSCILVLVGYNNINAQPFELIYGCSDSSFIGPIKNITVLEPLIQHDVQVIKNKIQSTINDEANSRVNYKLIDNDPFITKVNNKITLDLKSIVNSNIESDAILVIQYVLVRFIVNNSTPVDDSYNYSQINMYLFNNKCELIAVSSNKALSGDSFGITRNPLRGVATATRKSLNSIIKKIYKYNNNLLQQRV